MEVLIVIFKVNPLGAYPNEGKDLLYLCQDRWDDFGYKTSFRAFYYDCTGERVELGNMNVGYSGMEEGRVFDAIPKSFDELPDGFFSLGSEDYYEHMSTLDESVREFIYFALKDMAFNLQIFDKYEKEPVVQTSFLRGLTAFSVRQQLNRLSRGLARLTSYNFKYNSPTPENEHALSAISLEFNVIPYSNPPTNIHVIIGRNGSGKTRLIQNMVKSLQINNKEFGYYEDLDNPNKSIPSIFANVLCVAFSPFDDFSAISNIMNSILPFSYIGLDKESANLLLTIQEQFLHSFENSMIAPNKMKRWLKTIEYLKSDPTFEESHVHHLVAEWNKDKDPSKRIAKSFIKDVFSTLSSGHKVTLLIITSCVDKLEEKSIVFLDEPENHLHPPLLSAFVRALSYLLIDRNGVALISTHSPVVLQEVPKSCVLTLRRINTVLKAERLDVETFGSSISSLTSEVFGLEVTESGFHGLLRNAVFNIKNSDFNDIVDQFDGQLGSEALAIIRSLIAIRKKRESIT